MLERDGARASLWQTTTERFNSPAINHSGEFDVIIVGGGITGLATALNLQEGGMRCAVLEAKTLCFGTSGGTTAHLNTFLDTSYTTIISNFDKEKAALVANAARDGVALIERNVGKYSIDCQFERTPAYLFAQTDKQVSELEDISKACTELGVRNSLVDDIPWPLDCRKAMLVEDQAKFHPTRYVMGLARAFTSLGGVIIENCRVHPQDDDGPIEIETPAGKLIAGKLIFATHIPPGITYLNLRCAPYRSYAMAWELKTDITASLAYDMYDPYHYYRTQQIDGKTYLIAGGEDHKTGHGSDTRECFRKLEEHVRMSFELGEVANSWSSQYFEPVDGIAYIGYMPAKQSNILVATGFGGNGMTYSHISAMVFAELLLGKEGRYHEVFDVGRNKPVASAKNFIKENLDVAAKWLGKLLPADRLSQAQELSPGEGRIVKYEGETTALHRDEDGELHAVNPTCTHMKCHVAWNAAEQSWDCPCHGARFSVKGEVLTGPADLDLEKIQIDRHAETS